MKNLDVSIIVVNFNTRSVTSDCIDSVVEKTHGVSYEIILVDNASTDGSKEFFEKDQRITYIYSERNSGFGYGNNLGMMVAKGNYIFLLNSDTLLVNNAAKEFFDYAESHKEKKVYGCYLQHADSSYAYSFFYFPAFTVVAFLKRVFNGQNYLPGNFEEREVEAVCGADMFFHRSIYEQTGGFDEKIFLYGEEGEWQYRMRQVGCPAFIIPQPKIVHLEGKSSKESVAKQAIKLRSHFYILKKHMNPATYLLARCFYAVNYTLRNSSKLFNKEYHPLWNSVYCHF